MKQTILTMQRQKMAQALTNATITYSQDLAGNMLDDGINSYSWDIAAAQERVRRDFNSLQAKGGSTLRDVEATWPGLSRFRLLP